MRRDGLAAGRRACAAGRQTVGGMRRATAAGVSSGAAGGGAGGAWRLVTTNYMHNSQHAHDYLSRARLEVAKLCEELCPVVYPRSSRDNAVGAVLNNHMGWSAIG